jgi:AcrB/AcrD/AcrF family
MAGIIVNDAIVLVTTIDEYKERRGLFPAIVDGVADRFRPVLLTTLTTVLGLAPLLFEESSQAEFLKPTVITLVFGLGFGMVLVLLVVPALMAAQADIAQCFQALRRMLRGRSGTLRDPFGLAMIAMAGLAGALFGPVVWHGPPPGWISVVLPWLSAAPPAFAAYGAFMLGAGLLFIVAVGAALIRIRRRDGVGGSKLGGH